MELILQILNFYLVNSGIITIGESIKFKRYYGSLSIQTSKISNIKKSKSRSISSDITDINNNNNNNEITNTPANTINENISNNINNTNISNINNNNNNNNNNINSTNIIPVVNKDWSQEYCEYLENKNDYQMLLKITHAKYVIFYNFYNILVL